MLRLRQRRLAVRLARKYNEQFDGDMEKVKDAIKGDESLVGIDPAMVILIIQLILAVIKYFQDRKTSGVQMDDDEVLVAVGQGGGE
ncbi:MAG: hypothetical protein EBR82_36110 [Caulobacteraceae bacterium]|nr:hypothetical protein [Caulobacteraceae bacterium]